jgi:hypothetical protein
LISFNSNIDVELKHAFHSSLRLILNDVAIGFSYNGNEKVEHKDHHDVELDDPQEPSHKYV